MIPVTRANGVLAAFVQPSGGTISGQGCVTASTAGSPPRWSSLDRVGLIVNIPTYVAPNPDGRRGRFGGDRRRGGDAERQARKERLDAIKEQFRQALDYDRVVARRPRRKATAPTPDPRLAALAPYAKGEKPVIFRAENRVEILDALKLATDLKLKAIITGGDEAWKVADELKAAKVPVLRRRHAPPPDRADRPV